MVAACNDDDEDANETDAGLSPPVGFAGVLSPALVPPRDSKACGRDVKLASLCKGNVDGGDSDEAATGANGNEDDE